MKGYPRAHFPQFEILDRQEYLIKICNICFRDLLNFNKDIWCDRLIWGLVWFGPVGQFRSHNIYFYFLVFIKTILDYFRLVKEARTKWACPNIYNEMQWIWEWMEKMKGGFAYVKRYRMTSKITWKNLGKTFISQQSLRTLQYKIDFFLLAKMTKASVSNILSKNY